MKRVKRPTAITNSMKTSGTMLIIFGIIGVILSIPFLLIIIGIIPLIGSIMMIAAGNASILISEYEPLECSKCHTKFNPIKERVVCKQCKHVNKVDIE